MERNGVYEREPISQIIPKSALICEGYREDQTDLVFRVTTEEDFLLLNYLMSHPLILNIVCVWDKGGKTHKHANHRLNRIHPTYLSGDQLGIKNLKKYL